MQRTDVSHLWGGSVSAGLTRVSAVTSTSVSYPDSGCGSGIPLTTTPAYINVLNAPVLLNNNHDIVSDFDMSKPGGSALQIAGHFNNGITVLNDQAFSLTDFKPGLLSLGAGDMCTTTSPYCGNMLYFPGPGSNAPVAWLKNIDLSEECSGNGLTAFNGNTVIWDGGITQGFAQHGLSTGNRRGGFSNTILNDIYIEETNACQNPETPSCTSSSGCGNSMGVYSYGGSTRWTGGEGPQGNVPEFATGGSQNYYYYLVAIDSVLGASAPLYFGAAIPSGSTVNGFFPRVAQTNTLRSYTIIRTTDANNAPTTASCTGGSTTACGSVATGVLQCATLECSFSDNVSVATSAVTITDPTGYIPDAMFWPGPVIVSGTSTGCGNFTFDTNSLISGVVALCGRAVPTVATLQNTQGGFKDAYVQALGGVSTLLDDMNAFTNGLKGRAIVERKNGQTVPGGEIITLVDSNPSKTQASSSKRPSADSADSYIGNDAAGAALNAAQLAFGAPVAISSYIGNSGDNVSFLERLTATRKTFNVPVNVNGNLTVTGTCTGCGGGGGSGTVNSGTAAQLAIYSANGAAVSGDSVLTDNGSTLNYTGSSGISAAAGTFSGNVTVNGQLLVAGPWTVSSPIPGTAMGAAGAGTSALGISNDGNFYISANAGSPQKVATTATSSYFTNLFQEDANDLGEYNGATAQNLHVYSNYTNSSTWQRTSLGFDSGDGYAVVKSESSTSGGAPGLGLWVNSGLKWVVDASSFAIPVMGARVMLGKANGSDVFTGYVTASPQYEYLGWGEQGPVYRYNLVAQSDEVLLNQKALPNRSPFVDRSAGNALRRLAQDLLPGWFDTSLVQDVDTLAAYAVNPQKDFSFHAAEIALAARASFRTMNGALILTPVGVATYVLNESDGNFSQSGLSLDSPNLVVNELTVIGQDEPQAYVRDYFVGDGLSLKFYLSQKPFAQAKTALIDEEYAGSSLDPATWVVTDPSGAVSVAAQTLRLAGGTAVDGQTTVTFMSRSKWEVRWSCSTGTSALQLHRRA